MFRLRHCAVLARRSRSSQGGSEPIVCDTSPVSWQVVKAMEPVKMVNGNLRHSLRFGQPQVDRDATPALFVSFQRSPICHAATCGTKMEPDGLAADVGLGRTRDIDAFAFEVIVRRSGDIWCNCTPWPTRASLRTAIELRRSGRNLRSFQSPFRSGAPIRCTPFGRCVKVGLRRRTTRWHISIQWSWSLRTPRIAPLFRESRQANLRCASAGKLARTDAM